MASLKSPPPPLFPSPDPGGISSLDETVDGLMSCTETLGFESSNDIGKATCAAAEFQFDNCVSDNHETTPSRSKNIAETKRFPPPMSSLNPDGKRIFFLCPVRCQGRLELTEVKIERAEFLHASRADGRLRLILVETELEEDEEEEEDDKEEYDNEEEMEGDEDEDDRNWLFPAVICGGGDGGLKRCNEVVSRQDLQVWGQQHCVISR